MSDNERRVGLGKVIYTITDPAQAPPSGEISSERQEVEQADKESFPASDPPGFSGGTTSSES